MTVVISKCDATLCPKKWTTQLMVITLSKSDRFSKFFHRWKDV